MPHARAPPTAREQQRREEVNRNNLHEETMRAKTKEERPWKSHRSRQRG
jgi:hypothetical protein